MKKINDTDRLVPKPGKTKEFLKAFNDMSVIANGALGWQGQAEIMYETGIYTTLGIKKGSKSKVLPKIVKALQDSFLHDLYKYGEWLPQEEAEKRIISEQVLYGDPNESV